MNVFLVSQCDKRALTESRRILDQFAERRGDRSWQTAITQDGLDTLKKLLRKTARKNTAVACHWIRGIDRSELLWVVGDRQRFNDEGAVPTNTTRRNILKEADQNQWHSGELIQLLTDLAGLLHDLGKATQAFQMRLDGKLDGKNLVRHEWASLRLFEAFVGEDDDASWLARLAAPTEADQARWLNRLHTDQPGLINTSPFVTLKNAPLAQALGWLIVTHHRLPIFPGDGFQSSFLVNVLRNVEANWNEPAFKDATTLALKPFWQFPKGLSVTTPEWQHRAARVAQRLLRHATQASAQSVMSNPFVLHLSRLCLMLADHHYSSLTVDSSGKPQEGRITIKDQAAHPLLANTRSGSKPNQTLAEHLVGVAQHGAEVARFLPRFEQHLPRLGKHRALKQRSTEARYDWQNKAADLAASQRLHSARHGAFIVNMASTGCGKTLANARVMYALADPAQGMRCAFAMGLRTLTLQTGQAFRKLLSLGDDELAIRVGGAASRTLFDHFEQQAEASGSASRMGLFEGEEGHVLFEGQHDQHPLLRRAVADPQVRSLLVAPVLVCTVDHLTPATESQRGGRQIAPMLRLLSGDLVLDEIDDFDIDDLPALTRLVHWAGLLGARVLLSSATLPPALIHGLFEAYLNGRQHFQANRSERPDAAAAPAVACLWIDEFNREHAHCAHAASFEQAHQAFVGKRLQRLAEAAALPRRRLAFVPLLNIPKAKPAAAQAFAAAALKSALALHAEHHSMDPHSGKRVSFGLIRMANIERIHDTALALYGLGAPEGLRIHLCVYHSRFPLFVRSAIERQLDASLKRHRPNDVFELAGIRTHLDGHADLDHVFIVLGSPVCEVGRDHDYDWAVVEPSSLRSLIQLLGRVRRHRAEPCDTANVHVFSHNLRHYTSPNKAAFLWPGFEKDDGPFRLAQHDVRVLLPLAPHTTLDASPRIQAPAVAQLQAQHRWADLEHARMRAQMLAPVETPKLPTAGGRARSSGAASAEFGHTNASSWWHLPAADALLTGVIPQQQRFRNDKGRKEQALVFLPDEDGERLVLHKVLENRQGRQSDKLFVEVERGEHTALPGTAVQGSGIQPWGVVDAMAELTQLAADLDIDLRNCAKRFAILSAPESSAGWQSHPALGFAKRRE
ncbi:type I-F CRISPR-associated helicase Cas3f [Roseateles koreensis]|uniref:Type I-F CRISPR-associated helicase Cas3f n=1 Tax=Roseateles koreensis TaxID=2987526 RepID=A0ABT5KN84_9BURK|nr:type I-F CRISPR-associated helicase Cas3f [Roseateles koreensis]MDC8784383.1 type I-F CRISPR-associated helicase Cas3f [Roseateles koreensis]